MPELLVSCKELAKSFGATPLFEGLDLPGLDDLVFGGHEIRDTDLHCSAHEFAERAGILDPALLSVLNDDLREIGSNLRPGYVVNPTDAQMIRVEPGSAPDKSVIYFSGVYANPDDKENSLCSQHGSH